jgi:hypothetical protein
MVHLAERDVRASASWWLHSVRSDSLAILTTTNTCPSFGVAAFVLEMVPFANLIFAFTNTVGAALWAADLEKSAGTAPKLREQARKADEL